MSGAPERIWLDGDATIDEGVFPRCFATPKPASDPPMEFVRADIHNAAVLRSEQAKAREKALVEALRSVLNACDQGRMIPRPGCGAGGMTIEANSKGSVYTMVPAWPIETARDTLATWEQANDQA